MASRYTDDELTNRVRSPGWRHAPDKDGTPVTGTLEEALKSGSRAACERRGAPAIEELETAVELDIIQIEKLWRYSGLPVTVRMHRSRHRIRAACAPEKTSQLLRDFAAHLKAGRISLEYVGRRSSAIAGWAGRRRSSRAEHPSLHGSVRQCHHGNPGHHFGRDLMLGWLAAGAAALRWHGCKIGAGTLEVHTAPRLASMLARLLEPAAEAAAARRQSCRSPNGSSD